MSDTIETLVARVQVLEDDVALMRRALLSLGSHSFAGGPPGGNLYLAWHEDQLNPKAPPEPAAESAPINPTSTLTFAGTSTPLTTGVSPGSAASK